MISAENFETFSQIPANNNGLALLYFWADWAPQCEQMKTVLQELTKDAFYKSMTFISIEAEALPKISTQYGVNAVPTCIILRDGKKIDMVNGAHIPELVTKLKAALQPDGSSIASSEKTNGNNKVDDKYLQKLVRKTPVMLFMKGNPDEPKCGFSRQIVEILRNQEIDFGYFDILQDQDVREGLKVLFNWPTFPQLYVAGELQGGLDVVRELAEGGDLTEIVQTALNQHLSELVRREHVMLFMKGNPDGPRCGFSRQIVELLKKTDQPFGHFDILSDETVRQGLKTFSNWPTYPQLYVNGELLGGLDVVREMDSEGELVAAMQK